ncbi:hypothetical protein AB9G23_09600 [Francisella philomiragia]|uniref:hypothetical protein n=1 Tax=Francisella philomiragia TaxID=28110 RepID=UPI001908D453|nr:hypothetical protein [Francisella philomiragia]MBK2026186.1 hypothetical protein [Francisella philomiragia]
MARALGLCQNHATNCPDRLMLSETDFTHMKNFDKFESAFDIFAEKVRQTPEKYLFFTTSARKYIKK